MRRSPDRSSRRWIRIGLGALAAVWLAWVGTQFMQARRQTNEAIRLLRDAQAELTVTDLLEGRGAEQFRAAQAKFESAHDKVSSALVAPVRILPFVGRQVASVEALTGSAAEVVEVGATAIDKAHDAVSSADPTGAERVVLAEQVAKIAERARRDLADIDLGPTRLLAPLARARTSFGERLGEMRTAVADLAASSRGLGKFLEGPSRYLVLAANNGEMRVGSGTFLSVGELEVVNGRLRLDEMRSVLDFPVPDNAVNVAEIDRDLQARWGFLDPDYEWRTLGATPRFDVSARVAREMWREATGREVDGVLALDAVALKNLLAVTGPVTVDGMEINASNVVGEVLLGQYRDLSLTEYGDQEARRDRLAEIARAVIERFEAGGWDAAALVGELKESALGRHVMLWSADRPQQAGWRAASLDGTVGPDGLLVGVHNFGGNKLDQFLEVRAAIARRPKGNSSVVTITFDLTNTVPTGLPRYVAGPYPRASGSAEGRYQGALVVELPGNARNSTMTFDGERRRLLAAGADGPDNRVVATYVEVDRDQTRKATVRFELPLENDSFVVEPSARVPAINWFEPELGEWSDTQAVRVPPSDFDE